ncbi:MAG: hypothetical protein H7A00_00955 [Hahellaceae bacterium]|nr:hypothetical protein [Hahellaceae bacterium]
MLRDPAQLGNYDVALAGLEGGMASGAAAPKLENFLSTVESDLSESSFSISIGSGHNVTNPTTNNVYPDWNPVRSPSALEASLDYDAAKFDATLFSQYGAEYGEFYGSWGDDRLEGQSGQDKLFGFSGDDLIFGGDGNDWIEGDKLDDPGRYGGLQWQYACFVNGEHLTLTPHLSMAA